MLKVIKHGLYNRDILIGLPKLQLKNFKCQNITCGKKDKFKKHPKLGYICECGYISNEEHEIENTIKVKLYCSTNKCPESKTKMDRSCLKCVYIGER